MSLRVSFHTFGCKLNQAETDSLAGSFTNAGAKVVSGRAGHVASPGTDDSSQTAYGIATDSKPAPATEGAIATDDKPGATATAAKGVTATDDRSGADIFIFNTCTVTSKAEQKARRELRLALRNNPEAVALVTGCYAELDPDAVASIAPRTIVVPGSRKDTLAVIAPELVAAFAEGLDLLTEVRRLAELAAGRVPDPFAYLPAEGCFHSRVQLKIQDGCDNRCTYCRVCLARGRSVSLDPATIVSRAAALAASGVAEIVLTGVNLSQYSSGGLDFPGLLRRLVSDTDHVAYRVSSYEPDKVDDAFLGAFALPRVRPHAHLSVQSGSDNILRSMARRYDSRRVADAVAGLRSARHDPFIGFDLIAGFPGESDTDFSSTLSLVEDTGPAWAHVFTYSPRPGTRAYGFGNRVPERVAVERAAVLRAHALRLHEAFALRRVGTVMDAVAETADRDYDHDASTASDPDRTVGGSVCRGSPSTGRSHVVYATSTDYLHLAVSGVPEGLRGTMRCRVTGPAPTLHAQGPDGGADLLAVWQP